MRFYKKVGRLTEDEQAVIQQIEKLATEKGVPMEELATCHNFDDLLTLLNDLTEGVAPPAALDSKTSLPASEAISHLTEQTAIEGVESGEQVVSEQVTPVTTDDSDQIEQAVPVETVENEEPEQKASETIMEGEEQTERIASETTTDSKTDVSAFEDYDPFSDEIIERSYNGAEAEPQDKVKETVSSMESEPPLTESGSTPVDNLNPNTKRRAAEQTANALLKGYAKLAPKPFKWLAKIDEEKIERLSFDGQIDISIEVSEGMTFDDYMKQTNTQVDEIFEVEQETLDEIREPLVEVLMEQELELTPQQRLAMAVFSHLIQMLTVALKLRKQNNRILAYQKKITGMGKVQVA